MKLLFVIIDNPLGHHFLFAEPLLFWRMEGVGVAGQSPKYTPFLAL
jgi:hypothetical protein